MEKLMTLDEYTDYLKRAAKALEMDYVEMLERKSYLKYQAKQIKYNKLLTEGE